MKCSNIQLIKIRKKRNDVIKNIEKNLKETKDENIKLSLQRFLKKQQRYENNYVIRQAIKIKERLNLKEHILLDKNNTKAIEITEDGKRYYTNEDYYSKGYIRFRKIFYNEEKYWNEKQEYIAAGCGQCSFCRSKRQNDWVTRITLEMEGKPSCFLSMTYAKDIKTQGLNKYEVQKFFKRLRKNEKLKGKNKIKYISCGEYGDEKYRIHAHAIIIGWKPNDLEIPWTKGVPAITKKGKPQYESKTLYKNWKNGIATVQDVTPKTIKYITLYATAEQPHTSKKDKENNPKLWNMIKQMNQGRIADNKYIRQLWSYVKNAEFNTFSKGMGYKKFLEKEYLINDYKKIGDYEIPEYWLWKQVYEKIEKPIFDYTNVNFSPSKYLKEIEEYEYKVLRRQKAITILKEKQEYYNEFIFETFMKQDTYKTRTKEKIENIIKGINGTNAFNNLQNILKSKLKRKLNALHNSS